MSPRSTRTFALISGLLSLVSARVGAGEAPPGAAVTAAEQYTAATRDLFVESCLACHHTDDPSGGLDISLFLAPTAPKQHPERWTAIVERLRTGDMPPEAAERSQRKQQIDSLLAWAEQADASNGRDRAPSALRRLSRSEYSRTVEDLLGVKLRVESLFPGDDLGEGFDNASEVLSISPLLMEAYLQTAELVAERALGLETLPTPLQAEYTRRLGNLRPLDLTTVEAAHWIEHSADYELVVGLPGQRPSGSPPVNLVLWVDGKPRHRSLIPVAAPAPGAPALPTEERIRLPLEAGPHTFRLAFAKDAFPRGLTDAERLDQKSNKWINSLSVQGPHPSRAPAPRPRWQTCDLDGEGLACAHRLAAELAERAYRRPLRHDEQANLIALVNGVQSEAGSAKEGLSLAVQALLISPHFLFRREVSQPDGANGVGQLDGPSLASRLSYFLWSSMPDEELSRLGRTGRLVEPAVLQGQIQRMLVAPKASALAENFVGQWLELRSLAQVKPDPDRFPEWGPELATAFRTETELLFSWVLANNRPLTELLDARYTFANDVLARHYGLPGVEGPEFRKVSVSAAERGGLLGHASVLTVSSYPTRTSVVLRGKYVLQNLLGTPPPPPPPDVPALDEQHASSSASLRQQMEMHRANPTCASCHDRMDPLGFGLENYDAIGRWRSSDGGAAIDASGTLPGGVSFVGPAGLRQVLKARAHDFGRALTRKLLTYALGRSLERREESQVDAITRQAAAKGNGLRTLVQEVASSPLFRSGGVSSGVATGQRAARPQLDLPSERTAALTTGADH